MLVVRVRCASIWKAAINASVRKDSKVMLAVWDAEILTNVHDRRAEEMHSVATVKVVFNAYAQKVSLATHRMSVKVRL